MLVKDVMTCRAEIIRSDETIHDAARKMREHGVGVLVVCEEERPIGVLTDRDIVVRSVAEGRAPMTADVRSAMTTQIVSCTEGADLAAAAALMEDRAVRRVVVLDAAERLVGVLSVDDIALQSPQLAGEVVGRTCAPERPTAPRSWKWWE